MAGAVSLTFKGGAKMEQVLKQMAKRVNNAKAVNVGFLASATYPAEYTNRVEHRPSPLRGVHFVAQAAFWLEFGTKKQPPRPAIRNMIAEKSPRWGESLAYLAKATKYDARKMLTQMGMGIQGQMVESINNFTSPGNAPFTVQVKGFNKPWKDEGILLRSVDYEVVTK
jgi:hypothetical protein